MRHLAVLLGVLLLVVAGCSGDDAPAEPAATATQAPAATQPVAESTTPRSSAEAAVDATVVYEPGKCTYLGPAVIPRGTKATFEFDDGGHAVTFIVGRLIDGTTREEIIEYYETHGGPHADPVFRPYFAVEEYSWHEGTGLLVVEFRDDGDWTVTCVTPPDSTNKLYLGGMIKVIEEPAAESTTPRSSAEAAVDATVVYEPGNCTYLGPAVIPRGTKAVFEFDDGGHAVFFSVGLVIDGTTREEIIEYGETYGGTGGTSFGQLEPPYYLVAAPGYLHWQVSAGLLVVEFRAGGDWTVDCITTPESTDRAYLAGMIKVIEG